MVERDAFHIVIGAYDEIMNFNKLLPLFPPPQPSPKGGGLGRWVNGGI
jgi:hypothetical protein